MLTVVFGGVKLRRKIPPKKKRKVHLLEIPCHNDTKGVQKPGVPRKLWLCTKGGLGCFRRCGQYGVFPGLPAPRPFIQAIYQNLEISMDLSPNKWGELIPGHKNLSPKILVEFHLRNIPFQQLPTSESWHHLYPTLTTSTPKKMSGTLHCCYPEGHSKMLEPNDHRLDTRKGGVHFRLSLPNGPLRYHIYLDN